MLLLRKEDGTSPKTEAEARPLVEEELELLSAHLTRGEGGPLSNYERALVRTYLMLKLNRQLPNGASG
tara:strand:- start:681 stop:884 length:204 start_codon:yes stop_codon:yes gene_type:complete